MRHTRVCVFSRKLRNLWSYVTRTSRVMIGLQHLLSFFRVFLGLVFAGCPLLVSNPSFEQRWASPGGPDPYIQLNILTQAWTATEGHGVCMD